jgi:short-subunit dehydrogenase
MARDTVAVITGASSGIGAALADLLALEGAKLVLAARREEKLNEVANRARAHGATAVALCCDVTDRNAAERLINETIRLFGQIDILVNNAGRGHLADIEGTTDEAIVHMFAVNVYALWYTTRPALPYMKKQGRGHIINVASMAGKLGYPFNSAYVAAKHACVGFTHALRLELVETGIHASVICPGSVQTEWASLTEGGAMLPLFKESGPLIKKIAAERGMKLPPIEGVISAEAVAKKILECIRKPVAEVYTHEGSHEFVVLAAQRREDAERFQIPIVLGERQAYERIKAGVAMQKAKGVS